MAAQEADNPSRGATKTTNTTGRGMSAKAYVNRRVLAIQAKKKRYKPAKRKGKGNSQSDAENSGAHCSKTTPAKTGQEGNGQRQFSGDNGVR